MARRRGPGFLLWRKNVHHTGWLRTWLTAMGFSVVGLGCCRAGAVSIVRCCGLFGLTSGLGAGFYGTLVTSAVLQLAPTGQIGRVMVLSFSSMAAVPITYALTGLLTDFSTARVPFLIGGLLILFVAALAFANPELRQLTIDRTARAVARR